MTIPTSMRAAVYKGKGRVVEEEIPVPEVGPGDLLVEVSHCGICGSDLHFMVEDWAKPDTVHGDEYSGTVVAVGESVGGIERGDLVGMLGDRTIQGEGTVACEFLGAQARFPTGPLRVAEPAPANGHAAEAPVAVRSA